MKKGDILLINISYDPAGWLIKYFTKSKYNHAAWALNEYSFIHSTGRGIRIDTLSKYLNNKWFNVKVLRLKNLNKKQINKTSKLLVEQRCKVAYWKFFISFFLVAFGLKGLVQNCSNMIFNAMTKAGYTLTKKNNKYIVPEDFNKSPEAIDVTDELPTGITTWKTTKTS